MAEEVGAFQLLKAIAAKAALFPAAQDVVRRSVNQIVGAQLAADGTDLATVKKIRAALGAAAFAEAVDGLPAAKVKALVGRLDPHAGGLSAAADRLKHLLALAEGAVKPAAPAAAPAAASAKAAPTGRRRRITGRSALRVSEER